MPKKPTKQNAKSSKAKAAVKKTAKPAAKKRTAVRKLSVQGATPTPR